MGAENTPQDAATQAARIKELTEENEALFDQLHVVQEELEKYYHKLKACEQRQSAAPSVSAGEGQSPEALAENAQLRALVELQKQALRVETHNSLASRLGNMLIRGVDSRLSLFALPGKLRKMWKAVEQTTPPQALGGTSFQKVMDAYAAGGGEAVEKLLDSVFLAPVMRANAYTALARQLMATHVAQAAHYARLAWETDPRPYRLKWLAFRTHDAQDAVNAEAMLSMLPEDLGMSESEQRQAVRIREESRHARMQMARTQSGHEKNRTREVQRLTTQVTDAQAAAEKSRREAEQAKAQQAAMQKKAEQSQQEADALALQTAHMLKNLLTQFESEKAVLSKVVRVVMGAAR